MGEQCSTHREVRTKGTFIYDLGRDARMILKYKINKYGVDWLFLCQDRVT